MALIGFAALMGIAAVPIPPSIISGHKPAEVLTGNASVTKVKCYCEKGWSFFSSYLHFF